MASELTDVDTLIILGIAFLALAGAYLILIGLLPEHNRLAIVSFVCSALWVFALGSLVGLALGVVAVHRIDSRNERGHGLATAGILVGALGLVVTALLVLALIRAFKAGVMFGF